MVKMLSWTQWAAVMTNLRTSSHLTNLPHVTCHWPRSRHTSSLLRPCVLRCELPRETHSSEPLHLPPPWSEDKRVRRGETESGHSLLAAAPPSSAHTDTPHTWPGWRWWGDLPWRRRTDGRLSSACCLLWRQTIHYPQSTAKRVLIASSW